MWIHRVPALAADDCRVVVTDAEGHQLTIRVRPESTRTGHNIVLMLDDPGRHFRFRPENPAIATVVLSPQEV